VNYAAMQYVVEDSPSTDAAWKVLVVIAFRADRQTGECSASRRRLAKEARISTSTVHEALNSLIARGELEKLEAGAGRRSTAYRILVPDPASGSPTEPLQTEASDSLTEPLARSGSLTEPLDADRSDSPTEPLAASGSLTESLVVARSPSHKPVVARSPDSPNRKRREKPKSKELPTAPAAPTPPADDPETIDAEIVKDGPQPETAQTVLAAYIDWRHENGVNGFDRRTIGQLAKNLGLAFEASHPPEIIKRGLWEWHHSNQHPATLLSFIDAAARGASRNGHRLTDADRRRLASLQELLT
jgi:hypothetical protein